MTTPQLDGLPGPEGLAETDSTTQYALVPGLRSGSKGEEWALIRYVGQPIGEVIPLRAPGLSLGRGSGNGLFLSDSEVSRKHARLDIDEDPETGCTLRVQDLGSLNGTFVNGRKLDTSEGPVLLSHGDVVRVGGHAFKLKCMDEVERQYHEAILAQTSTDPLTGVSNRMAVLLFLEKQVEMARRHIRPLSLLLCDLDHFKDINDRHGHATGDGVLKQFGAVVLNRLRGSDLVGRIGGEEFLIVLPETGLREAVSVAEDLRRSFHEEVFSPINGGNPFQATCCLGAVQLRNRDLSDGSLLARADVALYRAKAAGRNRVEVDE